MRWKTLPFLLLSGISIAVAQDAPRLIDSPQAGLAGPGFNNLSGVEYSPSSTHVLVTQGASVSLIDATSLRAVWTRHFSGNLQSQFTANGAAILTYNADNGEVIELNPANGNVVRVVGTYDVGCTLRVGSQYFALFWVSEVDSTIAKIYRLSNGTLVREWTDERVESLQGNRGFGGTGTNEYFYSRRSRIKVDTGAVEVMKTNAAPLLNFKFAGADTDGNIVQEVWTRVGENDGTFVQFRLLRTDGTVQLLPAPGAGEAVSFAGFYQSASAHYVGIFTNKNAGGVLSSNVGLCRMSDGRLANNSTLTSPIPGVFPAGHIQFGRKMAPTALRLITLRPEANNLTSTGQYNLGSSHAGVKVGEIFGTINDVFPSSTGALYRTSMANGATKSEALTFINRRTKAALWTVFPSGTWTGTGVPGAVAVSPGGGIIAHAKTGRSVADELTLLNAANGSNLATFAQGYSRLAFLNETDLVAQRATGTQIDLLRLSGGTISTLRTYADSSGFPLTASNTAGKFAVTNFTGSRKDIKLYDTAGNVQTITLTQQPVDVEFASDGTLNVVSIGAANQLVLTRFNVAPATPAPIGAPVNLPITYTDANAVRAAISPNGKAVSVYAPSGAASAHFGQVRSNLKVFRIPDGLAIKTYTDFLPSSLPSLEIGQDGAMTYAVYGLNAPGFITPAYVDRVVAPAEVGGGDTFNLTIKMPWRVQEVTSVALSHTGGVVLPATVNVGVNSNQLVVPVTVNQTATVTPLTITATLNGINTSITLSIVPPRPLTLTLNPSVVKGGTSSTATLNIIGVAPTGGLSVNLSSNNAAATVPATVLVPEGTKTVNFTVNTTAVGTTVNAARISAVANGKTISANLKVEAPKVTSLTTDVANVQGGDKVKVTAVIDGPAPTGGLTVNVTSSATSAIANTTIVIPAGATSASKLITSSPVYPDQNVTLTGTYQTSSATANVTVRAARIIAVVVSPGRVQGGETYNAFVLFSSGTSANYPINFTINGVTTSTSVPTAGIVMLSVSLTMPNLAPGVYTLEAGNALGSASTLVEILP